MLRHIGITVGDDPYEDAVIEVAQCFNVQDRCAKTVAPGLNIEFNLHNKDVFYGVRLYPKAEGDEDRCQPIDADEAKSLKATLLVLAQVEEALRVRLNRAPLAEQLFELSER